MHTFRRATVDDREMLAELALRSKAHWGYDPDFIERCRPALTPPVDYLRDWPVYVLEEGGRAVGFYGFWELDGELFLYDMFLEPQRIRCGLGQVMWDHCVETARTNGYGVFLIESDPFAEPFYLKMGAERIGEILSEATGRALPLLRFTVPQEQR